MKFACHYDPQNRRSAAVAFAMVQGAKALGHLAQATPGFEMPCGDVCVAYGWAHPQLFERYLRHGGRFVYVDLGWWHRKPEGDVLAGYHKVVVNGREPTGYFRRQFPSDRFARTGAQIYPWRAFGSHLLLAGMSEKSAATRGFRPQEWEAATAKSLAHSYPHRRLVYRPKPSWHGATPIPGTTYSGPGQPLDQALRDCWAVVTNHSNVAVDALLAGIPIHVQAGVAFGFSTPMHLLETPYMPGGRDQLMADIAYCQWSMAEIRSGACLAHLLENTPLCA